MPLKVPPEPSAIGSSGIKVGKLMKPGKVVLVLASCYFGCKAVIAKSVDDDTSACILGSVIFYLALDHLKTITLYQQH